MLFDPARHEELSPIEWDENRVRGAIAHIAADIEDHFSEVTYWPSHPLDLEGGDDPHLPGTPLYHGACGVIWLNSFGSRAFGSYLMGDIPILMLAFGNTPTTELGDRIAALIASNVDSPARELMWGSPGTMLAALFLYERTGQERWADLFRRTAGKLWTQLQWSPECACHYWIQDLYGHQCTYLDGVHGFVATALPIIRGRGILSAESFAA